jgi:hypothetical protein
VRAASPAAMKQVCFALALTNQTIRTHHNEVAGGMDIRPIEHTPIGRSGRIACDCLARRSSERTLIGFIAMAWIGGDITTKIVLLGME